MNIKELDINIKKELRACMNVILSARMREAGMPFKLIFGVELPRLCSIADEFPQNKELANYLWNQNIRETKLLAIMLMSPEAFTPELSNNWAKTMVTAEEAQVMAMLLLSKTSHAKETSITWLKEGKPLPSVCACLCLRHLLVQDAKLETKEIEIIGNYMTTMLPTANLHLRKAIQTLKEELKV
jgi:hypothetical protein